MQTAKLGIDIGSKTIKLVALDDEHGAGNPLFTYYHRHHSRVQSNLYEALHRFLWLEGERAVEVTVTGSAGLRVAEVLGVPFVQEVVALKHAVQTCLPDTDVVLEMGGEDTKLVYLSGVPEQRMNTVCAGGTGGFIDMMAGVMGVRTKHLDSLAMGHTTIYPIASRCAVFAKSDVRPLINAGARKEDIAASVLQAVCMQAVAGLSAGRPIEGHVVLLGGPFEHIGYLRQAFCEVTGLAQEDVSVPEDAHLFVALGAALAQEKAPAMELSRLERLVAEAAFESQEELKRLPPLFESAQLYERFCERHSRCKVPRASVHDASENLFIGIDAGSTTVKVVLLDEDGNVCSYRYASNGGDVTKSLPRLLCEIYGEFRGAYTQMRVVRRSCIIGYGEDLCRAAYGVDMGEVETVAHLRAALELDDELDFLLDIGGQDIKCFYVEDGKIEDVVLNEACSSGCGSLFESVAHSLRLTKTAAASEALQAARPVDLGTRCSTFMDSRVKHAQKEGATPGDIAAGVCYATARNALFKVVRQPDFTNVGEHIVVQGGAFANDALLRAFELETGVEVKRPDLSPIMGAWGAALLARDEWRALRARDAHKAARVKSTLLDAAQLEALRVRRTNTRCSLCTNTCKLTVVRFTQGNDDEGARVFVTGNRCERGAAALGDTRERPTPPPNMLAVKRSLLAACDKGGQPDGTPLVGIPRVLALYESYPFWKTFFNALGLPVISTTRSDEGLYRKGMGCIPAEGACYPSKLLYGHVAELVERGAQVVFAPAMRQELARSCLLGREADAAARECPLIERVPELLATNARSVLADARLLSPDLLCVRTRDDMAAALESSLAAAGLPFARERVVSALDEAQRAYEAFLAKLQAANERVLARVDAGEFEGALLAGHAYHADEGIGHEIDTLLGELGYAVLERLEYPARASACDGAACWQENRELSACVDGLAAHPNVQLIVPRSFGCGIDALYADKLSATMHARGRVYAEIKLDQIEDTAAVRIRLRSLAYAARQRAEVTGAQQVRSVQWQLMTEDEIEHLRHDPMRLKGTHVSDL